MSKRAVGSR